MRLWIELSGEHPTLPRAEVLAALAAERVDIRRIAFGPAIVRLDAIGAVERAVSRLGLSHLVAEELAVGDLDAVRAYARETDLAGRTFRVRARGLDLDVDVPAIEVEVGAEFARTGKVNLDRPSLDFRLLIGDEFVLGRVVHRVDRTRLEARKVSRRPFSLPISLHPKFARAVVNLSRVPIGGKVLDPFCGTGGIVLEAADVGLVPIGLDRMRSMVVGTARMLRPTSLAAHLAVADAGRPPFRRGSVSGIATDPPYGRAASTRGEPLPRLYERTFDAIRTILPQGGHAAVVLPNEKAIDQGSDALDLVESHALRVHRSLVRHFCVFVNASGAERRSSPG